MEKQEKFKKNYREVTLDELDQVTGGDVNSANVVGYISQNPDENEQLNTPPNLLNNGNVLTYNDPEACVNKQNKAEQLFLFLNK